MCVSALFHSVIHPFALSMASELLGELQLLQEYCGCPVAPSPMCPCTCTCTGQREQFRHPVFNHDASKISLPPKYPCLRKKSHFCTVLSIFISLTGAMAVSVNNLVKLMSDHVVWLLAIEWDGRKYCKTQVWPGFTRQCNERGWIKIHAEKS